MSGITRVVPEVLRGGFRVGPSLIQNLSPGSFKLRVYGSWFDGIAKVGSTSVSKKVFSASSVPSISKGLKDLATSISRDSYRVTHQATLAQKSFYQHAFQNQSQRAISSIIEIRAIVRKAFSQEGSRRLFSGATKITKKLGGDANGGAATKANEGSYPGKRFVEWYIQKIDERPLLVKSLTAGSIFVLSDLCAQAIGGWYGGYDFARSLRMAAFGLFLSGPLLHFWFGLMTRMYPGRDLISVCKKIFIGQTTVGPLFTAIFYSLNAALQGEDADAIWARLKRDLIPTLKAGLAYWPLVDFFTYSRVPVYLMPLTNNTASFLWTIYITYIAGKGKAGEDI